MRGCAVVSCCIVLRSGVWSDRVLYVGFEQRRVLHCVRLQYPNQPLVRLMPMSAVLLPHVVQPAVAVLEQSGSRPARLLWCALPVLAALFGPQLLLPLSCFAYEPQQGVVRVQHLTATRPTSAGRRVLPSRNIGGRGGG